MKMFFLIITVIVPFFLGCSTEPRKMATKDVHSTTKENSFGLPDSSRKFTSEELKMIEKEISKLESPMVRVVWYDWLANQYAEKLAESLNELADNIGTVSR